ncbi:hypothetical protein [Marinobacter sp.]|uniref:hypothetical protein n=1 Tax=Marinobacter sp. TaxID=50741 RepID=UPI0035653696
MRILTLIGILFAFAMGATAQAEGVSKEDAECGNKATCLQSPGDEDHGSAG